MHGLGQFPAHEWGAIAQGTGLAVQQGDIVPGFKIADIAGEAPLVRGNDILTGYQHDPASISAQ